MARCDVPGTVGLDPILPTTWYSQETIDGLKEEFESGLWDTDTLLMATISSMDDLYLQSHTVSHLARDNLGVSDCETEDGGESSTQITWWPIKTRRRGGDTPWLQNYSGFARFELVACLKHERLVASLSDSFWYGC